MKIISILFYKKFDYVVFPIGLIAGLIIIVDLFYTTNIDASMQWSQLFMVFLYYFATRGRAERNFLMHGIEPIIVLSFFGFLVVFMFLTNMIFLMNLLV